MHFEVFHGAQHNEEAWAKRVGPFSAVSYFPLAIRSPKISRFTVHPGRFREQNSLSEGSMCRSGPFTILCITSYEKGQEFLRTCKNMGCRVLLLTVEKLRDGDWPREAIDELFFMPEELPVRPSSIP